MLLVHLFIKNQIRAWVLETANCTQQITAFLNNQNLETVSINKMQYK